MDTLLSAVGLYPVRWLLLAYSEALNQLVERFPIVRHFAPVLAVGPTRKCDHVGDRVLVHSHADIRRVRVDILLGTA